MLKPNNVTRLLEARKIPYTAFELPAEKLGAVEAARIMGVPVEQVFKTIVITREGKGKPILGKPILGKPILAVVPGPGEVDLKALAKALNEKKVHLPTEREAERLTGLQAGGISPLALLNRGFQVVIDRAAENFAEIYISGGQRGLDIRLPTQALVKLTNAILAVICRAAE
jgi:Cys-tRNA(Pro)/Cys-tRNA(Cys) deacylase